MQVPTLIAECATCVAGTYIIVNLIYLDSKFIRRSFNMFNLLRGDECLD